MLEFIVLGIVPGTRFHITLSWVLAAAAVFLMLLELRYHKQYALQVQAAEALATDNGAKTTQKKVPTKRKAPSKSTPKSATKKTATKKITTNSRTKKTAAKSSQKRTATAKKPSTARRKA